MTALPGFERSDADELDILSARYKWLGVSVDDELVKMEAWLMANPRRRKRNGRRFVVNWLNKAAQTEGARLLASRVRKADPWGYRAAMDEVK